MAYRDIKINTKKGSRRLNERGSHDQRARSARKSNSFAHDNDLDTNNLNGSGTNITENGTLDFTFGTKKNKK